ncbi:hypothetical protein Bhyg_15574, partial [Pseudolycoriella hygida]
MSESTLSGVDASNGQYPWSVFTIAWEDTGIGLIGTLCSCSIITLLKHILLELELVGLLEGRTQYLCDSKTSIYTSAKHIQASNKHEHIQVIRYNHRIATHVADVESTLSGVYARNGQYPWSLITIAWVAIGSGYSGISCSSSIISKNFALSDSQCIRGSDLVETYPIGTRIGWPLPRPGGVFMRHYWYIEPSSANSPNIVLLRFHEALTLSPNVQPIRLPAPGDFSYEGWASISLWFAFSATPNFAEQLQFVNNNIPRNADCTFQSNFPDHELCSVEQARITGEISPATATGFSGTSCSSSIISKNFALSDSQIIRGSDIVETYPIGVRIGWPFPRPDAVFMRHYWYIEPSSANSPNIVLLRFHEALTLSPNVQPIRLPAPGDFSYEGWASISLWFSGTPSFADQLQFVNNNIPRNADCTFQSNFPDHEMCSIEQARIIGNTAPGGAWVLYEYNEFNYHSTLVGIHKSRFTNETSTIVETFPLGARISYPFRRQDAVFMRHYWYIEPSSANSPNIVLLRFHEALTFSPNVQPIRLPAPDNFSYEGWASMSLWFTLAITPEFAEQLQFVNNNIPRNADCTFQSNFPDHEMCSIEQARITGNTPPGGAWVLYEYNEFNYHATLVGIHKSRFTNETSTYGVATRVSHFVEWIGELTAEALGPIPPPTIIEAHVGGIQWTWPWPWENQRFMRHYWYIEALG